MKISDLIEHLEALQKEYGDLNVCRQTDHDYWGYMHSYLTKDNMMVVNHAQPLGPKSGQIEQALIFEGG